MNRTAPDLTLEGIEVSGPATGPSTRILTPEALRFVANLARRFEPTRRELLAGRQRRQDELAHGRLPDFLESTRPIRESEWKVAAMPHDLTDRRVEITGPVDRKMIINALNSGANVYMADFEDSNSPTWQNNIEGQNNLKDAAAGVIEHTSPEGKSYRLAAKTATLMVRPRGWHLHEKHMTVDGHPVSASLFDFGLYFYHNAQMLMRRGTGPYFYLPKIESHLEARLWNDVFTRAQEMLGVPVGTIRATVLVETILAAFEMDEILYELREHSAGLNCGRWDYIFSFIKKFRERPDFVLPDRAAVTMDRSFLRAYVELLVATCHRRGAHALGGMAAQIPIKNDPAANEAALARVREDKLREVKAGHDGTWVAHPGLVPVAREVFDAHMPGPHQIGTARGNPAVTAAELLEVPRGDITERGLRHNIDVGIQYLEAWLQGSGCVPIYNLMEDAATAEISRSQVWQWVRHGARLSSGTPITAELVRATIREEMARLPDTGSYKLASRIFEQMMTTGEFAEFLTLVAYDYID